MEKTIFDLEKEVNDLSFDDDDLKWFGYYLIYIISIF